jgi:uncharacterized membrane protein YfcA
MIETWLYPVLTAVAFCTGFIDAIAGGGGLIMVPALLFAGVPPLQTLGTNKAQSMCGTAIACFNYARSGLFNWSEHWWTVLIVFVGASAGVIAVQAVGSQSMGLVIPILLMAVALYVLLSPRMTDEDAHERIGEAAYKPVAGAIGFYDGFFGPGTGSFFTSSLVGLRGMGLTRATALTKLFNLTSNVGSVIFFAIGGQIYWLLGACMAVGAMAGGWAGSHSAIRFGAKLIRPLLVVLSLGLTFRLLWGYFNV